MDHYSNIAENVKDLRLDSGKTQEQLAEEFQCITEKTYKRWESGKSLTFDNQILISEFYDIPLGNLYIKNYVKDQLERQKNLKAKTDPNESIVNTVLPWIDPSSSESIENFKKAAELDLKLSSSHFDPNSSNEAIEEWLNSFAKMCKLYLIAFTGGSMEAGINILRTLFKFLMAKAQTSGDLSKEIEANAFLSKSLSLIQSIIFTLLTVGHPAGKYYLALGLLYDFFESSTDLDKCSPTEKVIRLIIPLVNEGNKYAISWLSSLNPYGTQGMSAKG